MSEPRTYLKIWDTLGSYVVVGMSDESRLNAFVSQWVESGRTRDTLIDLTLVDGDPYFMLASNVKSWMISTPEGRLRALEFDKAGDDEAADNRTKVGLPYDDDRNDGAT